MEQSMTAIEFDPTALLNDRTGAIPVGGARRSDAIMTFFGAGAVPNASGFRRNGYGSCSSL